jgi:hypothetical protein
MKVNQAPVEQRGKEGADKCNMVIEGGGYVSKYMI